MSTVIRAPELRATDDAQVVLVGVRVDARLHDLLSVVTVEQVYSNREQRNIEAVYTFPLPADAELMDLEVQLGERRLKGTAVKKAVAQERYEDAVTDGDTAVMLEQSQPGIFTMNVGNLLAGETARIRFRYAELHRWHGDSLRFTLPTVIAPRYGAARRAGMQPHAMPETDTTGTVQNGYSLRVEVSGLLADATIDSPSHAITVARSKDSTVIAPKEERAMMDCDFVLNLKSTDANRSSAVCGVDINGHVVLASFSPSLPSLESGPRRIKIVVDCSGSMKGDSIAQAREALRHILDRLRPQDEFDIIAFGSAHQSLFGRALPATKTNIKHARAYCSSLDATMGGTEIGAALAAAYRTTGEADIHGGDVLLITDGEVWDSAPAIAEAQASCHRIFAVGVGSAVAEPVVRGLAEKTGGACELVAPRDGMAERVVRHFNRIYACRAQKAKIVWPGQPDSVVPELLSAIFDGDTIHVFGRFAECPTGNVGLKVWLDDGSEVVQRVPLQTDDATEKPSTIARLGAAVEVRGIAAGLQAGVRKSAERAAALAEAYGLVSEFTNYLVVQVRAEGEKAEGLPDLRKVRQMMPNMEDVKLYCNVEGVAFQTQRVAHRRGRSRHSIGFEGVAFLRLERPAAVHSHPLRMREAPIAGAWAQELIARLDALHPDEHGLSLQVKTIAELASLGLPESMRDALNVLVADGVDEFPVVVCLLHALVSSGEFSGRSRALHRAVRQAYKAASVPSFLPEHIRFLLAAQRDSEP